MKKETIYIIAIVLLILLNLLQLGGRFLENKPQPNLRERVINHLNLGQDQQEKFFDYAKSHRKKMRQIQIQQRALTRAYFEEPSEALLNELSQFETQKIQLTEAHFNTIKTILREDQYDEFEEFKKKALSAILQLRPPRQVQRQQQKP